MAIISSHTLNGNDGTHAAGVAVTLTDLRNQKILFSTATDDAGRLSQSIELDSLPTDTYELTFRTGDYWRNHGVSHTQIIEEIVLRLKMPDVKARYHLPIIFSPNSYSTWASVAE